MDKKIEDYLPFYLGCQCVWIKTFYPHKNGDKFILDYNAIKFWVGKFKPILRPERDMTEEENEHYMGTLPKMYSDKKYHTGSLLEAERFRYLLSIGIDLFELIESGLAIDATTLKNKTHEDTNN